MTTSERQRRLATAWLAVVAASAAGGSAFGLLQGDYAWIGVPRGALTGALIGGTISGFELAINAGPVAARVRTLPLAVLFAIRTVAYVAAIAAGEMLARQAFIGTVAGAAPAFDRQFVNTMAFSIPGAMLFNLVFVMIQMLGPSTLGNLVTGRYHRPREEERIFMFVDIAASTGIAERIGNLRFHALLSRFFADLTTPVVENGGTIYRYVGDEMIVTWPMADAARNARPIRAYAQMRTLLARQRPAYEAAFGLAPEFRVALHAGPVVTGEMGSWKREITFLGDVVNSTARIEAACRETGRQALVSKDLVDRLTPPAGGPKLVPIGPVALRGRRAEIELFAIEAGDEAAWQS